jgi:hypothetical protein
VRLGVIIQHYDARNDVRDVVTLLSADHEVVLFGHGQQLASIASTCEKRAFVSRRRVRDRVWLQLWNFFGALPRSLNNYLITELFKLASLPRWRRVVATIRLRLRMALPRFMTFDFLLDRLKGSDCTEVADIDRFLIITELTSAAFLARVLDAGKPVDAYVYSWDHACKHASFSRRVDRWFVWNAGIAQDLVQLQGIEAGRIHICGATQLAYINEYLYSPDRRPGTVDKPYVYYGCGVGHVGMARQEARLIALVADELYAVDPGVLLVVRPYPMLAETSFFQDLRRKPNVVFDEGYRESRSDRSLRRNDIFSRLEMQDRARAFVHCGTTMGLEGAYLRSPMIFLDLEDFDYGVAPGDSQHLRKFIHQYHNEKYMLLDGHRNVVRKVGELRQVLRDILRSPGDFLSYSREIEAGMKLRSLEEIVAEWFAPTRGGPACSASAAISTGEQRES